MLQPSPCQRDRVMSVPAVEEADRDLVAAGGVDLCARRRAASSPVAVRAARVVEDHLLVEARRRRALRRTPK